MEVSKKPREAFCHSLGQRDARVVVTIYEDVSTLRGSRGKEIVRNNPVNAGSSCSIRPPSQTGFIDLFELLSLPLVLVHTCPDSDRLTRGFSRGGF